VTTNRPSRRLIAISRPTRCHVRLACAKFGPVKKVSSVISLYGLAAHCLHSPVHSRNKLYCVVCHCAAASAPSAPLLPCGPALSSGGPQLRWPCPLPSVALALCPLLSAQLRWPYPLLRSPLLSSGGLCSLLSSSALCSLLCSSNRLHQSVLNSVQSSVFTVQCSLQCATAHFTSLF
jgi:hypothetical protein